MESHPRVFLSRNLDALRLFLVPEKATNKLLSIKNIYINLENSGGGGRNPSPPPLCMKPVNRRRPSEIKVENYDHCLVGPYI